MMSYMSKLHSEEADHLFKTVLELKTEEECYRFFEDLLTVSELSSMTQRWEVARMLNRGSTYQAIVAKTGASSATISRVNRCLHYGADGYRLMLDRMKEPSGSGKTKE